MELQVNTDLVRVVSLISKIMVINRASMPKQISKGGRKKKRKKGKMKKTKKASYKVSYKHYAKAKK
tara:strand:- start:322 stop:519 length:198 start_codon:yes stop_codon:yes gene_type:complete